MINKYVVHRAAGSKSVEIADFCTIVMTMVTKLVQVQMNVSQVWNWQQFQHKAKLTQSNRWQAKNLAVKR